MGKVILGDNLPILRELPDDLAQLIYIDPPFNTGRRREQTTLQAIADANGSHRGFQGRRYTMVPGQTHSYDDSFDDYLAFLEPRLIEARRVLAKDGTLYVHTDSHESHYTKVMLDQIFGRRCFLNEIIWAYDFGGRATRRWPSKHDTILAYVQSPRHYIFNTADIDREPYMAPGLVGPEKAERGKLPTDVWWHTIVSPTGKEKTGYPTQKPLAILRRIIRASSNPGGLVLDFFAGSGTTGIAAAELGRDFLLVDNNPEAFKLMARRFAGIPNVEWINGDRASQ